MRWWRLFVDRLTGRLAPEPSAQGPRRRSAARHAHRTRVTARAASWPRYHEGWTAEVGDQGLELAIGEAAQVGEAIEAAVMRPNGNYLTVVGRVTGAREGRLFVRLDALEPQVEARWREFVATAAASAPKADPADEERTRPHVRAGSSGSRPRAAAATDPRPSPRPTPRPTPRPRPANAGPIVGIDLGTTYTSVSAIRGDKIVVLADESGARSIPSVIAFPSRNEMLVGARARARLASDPAHTVVSPKRLLGRTLHDREIEPYLAHAPYPTSAAPDGSIVIEMWDRPYAIPQLCASILGHARDLAERALGERISRAVLTVPVSFDERRLQQLRRAGELAQLEVVATIDEPSAAALANRFLPGFGGLIGVLDFGGGTCDFSLVEAGSGDFKVLATAGDSWLGGDDFDLALADHVANQVWRDHRVDLRKQQVEWQRLVFACEQAKRALTTQEHATIEVPEAIRAAGGTIDLAVPLDRSRFEEVCASVISRALVTCDDALKLLDVKPSSLTAIYLSGGTTYVPAVRAALARHLRVPVKTGVPPEHAVCLGAGIHAAQIQLKKDVTLPEHGLA